MLSIRFIHLRSRIKTEMVSRWSGWH